MTGDETIPQLVVDGKSLGDADSIQQLIDDGELRRTLCQ